MSCISLFIEDVKLEINRLDNISIDYKLIKVDAKSKSDLNASLELSKPLLDEFKNTLIKITRKLPLYRDLAQKKNEEISSCTNTMKTSLINLYNRVDCMSEYLTDILHDTENMHLNHKGRTAKKRSMMLGSELGNSHDNISEIARIAALCGNLKAKAAVQNDLVAVMQSVKRLWELYYRLRTVNEIDNVEEDGTCTVHKKKNAQAKVKFCCKKRDN